MMLRRLLRVVRLSADDPPCRECAACDCGCPEPCTLDCSCNPDRPSAAVLFGGCRG